MERVWSWSWPPVVMDVDGGVRWTSGQREGERGDHRLEAGERALGAACGHRAGGGGHGGAAGADRSQVGGDPDAEGADERVARAGGVDDVDARSGDAADRRPVDDEHAVGAPGDEEPAP